MAGEPVVAIFPSRSVLVKALDRIVELEYLDIERTLIVAKAKTGETVILDDGIGVDEGGVAGGTLGAAITALGLVQMGVLALPGVGPILALGAGALVGALVGRVTGRFAINLLELGLKDEQIEALAYALQEGHPALVIELKNDASILARLREELQPYNAELVERLNEAKIQTGKLREKS